MTEIQSRTSFMSSGFESRSMEQDSHSIGHESRSIGHQASRKTMQAVAPPDAVLPSEAFIYGLQLDTFFSNTEENQEAQLERLDVMELYNALQEIHRELALARLENHFLTDFLEKNDPKLLIGINLRKSRVSAGISSGTGRSHRDMGSISIVRPRSSMHKSVITAGTSTTASMGRKPAHEFKLNFRAKADMADKTTNDAEKRLHDIEKSVSHNIKVLRGHIEEMHYMHQETQETINIFQLHFLNSERDRAFLNTASEKQLERKIKKFVNNWLKNGRALLSTMRLRITALHEHCQQLRNELITKSDLSGILTAIDFEKLIIKRTELQNSLEEKNLHMAGLKAITGRAGLSMSEEKKIMTCIEAESKYLNQKTLEVVKTISKLNKEAQLVEKENKHEIETLQYLKLQLERYEAPSVHDYISKKDELLALEKEQKMLHRKINILEMKLENTQRRCKRHENIIN